MLDQNEAGGLILANVTVTGAKGVGGGGHLPAGRTVVLKVVGGLWVGGGGVRRGGGREWFWATWVPLFSAGISW